MPDISVYIPNQTWDRVLQKHDHDRKAALAAIRELVVREYGA